jgi:hypothetical protein
MAIALARIIRVDNLSGLIRIFKGSRGEEK